MISFASDFRYRSACRWLDTLSQTVKTASSMHTVSDDVTYSVITTVVFSNEVQCNKIALVTYHYTYIIPIPI